MLVTGLLALGLRRAGLAGRRVAALSALRLAGLAALALLLARPQWVTDDDPAKRRTVAILVDQSRSMSLVEDGAPRYRRAAALAAGLPAALERRGFKSRSFGFGDGIAPLDLASAAGALPDQPRTDLAGAFLQANVASDPAPAAILAVTDGAANRTDANETALLALLESRTPVVAVGFGSDAGLPTLNLLRAVAPPRVAPRQSFRVSAQLQSSLATALECELVLMRDGQLRQTRRLTASPGQRFWMEGFDVVETDEGRHEWSLLLRPPPGSAVVSASTRASVPVVVGREKEFRVLFVQGALTWDFKFISRALRGDPSVRVTGLSRTSKQSVFRQNVESAGELASGFPNDLAEIAPYRVIVLSELKPADLTPAQQELIARFCGELGGGVLVIGGESTFDASWQGSRLEQLLPVSFDSGRSVAGLDKPFHLQLTDEALRHPAFQVSDDGSSRRIWESLPTFTGYGRVLREKPGATVWARHESDQGPAGRRVLMASQFFGGGVATVICVQNLWRWRLAKELEPRSFDRFWQQLLRMLGQSGRQDFQIQFVDQELATHQDVRALVERRPQPESGGVQAPDAGRVALRVRGPGHAVVLEQQANLVALRPVEIRFRAEQPGLYTVAVEDGHGLALASQSVEIRDMDRETERTARDMETLRQWATTSGGAALEAESVRDADALAAAVKERIESVRASRPRRLPAGVNAPVLAALLACFCGEWALRRVWGLA